MSSRAARKVDPADVISIMPHQDELSGETSRAAHSSHSLLREKIVEHVFVGEALRALWRRGVFDVQILRAEFDVHGYDLVMERGKIVRHIQFKTGVRKPQRVLVSSALAEKPSGCVIWILVNNGLDMMRFWWLGDGPQAPLPSLGDRRYKRRGRPRENQRVVNRSQFRAIETLDELLETLLGPLN